jgi:hypothetical protein
VSEERCRDAFEAFARREFGAWEGLPAGCGLAGLRAAAERVDEEPVAGRLGSPTRQVQYHAVALGDSAGPARAWVSGGAVVLLDSELPSVPGGAAQLERELGPPAVRRAARWDVLELPEGEWVWPDRGVAALVGGEGMRVLRLLVFSPAPLAAYDERLRPGFGVREFREGP